MPDGEGLSQDELYLLQLELSRAKTNEEAQGILNRLASEGRITEEQTDSLIEWYVENVSKGAEAEKISPVVSRERQIAIDEAIMRVLRDPDVPMADKATIRGPEGQKLVKAYLEKGDKNFLTVVENMLTRAGAKREEERGRRETHLSQVLEEFERDPVVEPYLKDIREWEKEAYYSGESDELLPKLSRMWMEAYEARRAETKEARGARRAEAALAGIAELGKPPPKEEFVRPPIPGTEKVSKAFLEETGLAKGTKLRSFLAGEIIPEIIEKTRGARGRWWARMHPEPSYERSIDEEIASTQEQARRWANLAWGPEASTEEVLGGTYWGPGGLAARAERAYRHAVETLGKRMSEQEELRAEEEKYGVPEVPKPGKDPLIGALGKKKWRPEYYRKPGAGLVRALTPAIRY